MKAYNLNDLTVNGVSAGTLLNGAGETLAVYELDGDPPSDIQTYENQFLLPNVPLQNVLLDGATGTPETVGGQSEVTLDIQLEVALAPGASKIMVYEGQNSDQGLIDIFNRIAADNLAKSVCVTWGASEDQTPASVYNAENQTLMQMAAQGQSVFSAAGDFGAFDDPGLPSTLEVDDPGSQVYDTCVGGTSLSLNSNGTYLSETTWNNAIGTGGGGVSSIWTIPGYQAPVVAASTDTELSGAMRNVPDVSLNADPEVGFSTFATLAW